ITLEGGQVPDPEPTPEPTPDPEPEPEPEPEPVLPVAPTPTDVTADPGPRRVDLRWDLPATDAEITGFEITRSADGAVTHVGPDVRAWRDRKLVNGWSYHYSIRALAAGGPSAPAVSPTAVPAARPARPA